MTKREFFQRYGRLPERDDLDRVNCPDAGKLGHINCGLCSCGLPRFECSGQFARCDTPRTTKLHGREVAATGG